MKPPKPEGKQYKQQKFDDFVCVYIHNSILNLHQLMASGLLLASSGLYDVKTLTGN